MPLTGDPKKDIPELMAHGHPQKQAVAIALKEQRGDGCDASTEVLNATYGAAENVTSEPVRVDEAPEYVDTSVGRFAINRSYDVPTLACSAPDSDTIYIDKDWQPVADGYDRTAALCEHEAVEKRRLDAGEKYASQAHPEATTAEDAKVRADGQDPAKYQATYVDEIKACAAKKDPKLPPGIEPQQKALCRHDIEHARADNTGASKTGLAAGILFLTKSGKALLMHRGQGGDHPGTWGLPGGHQEGDESLEDCARREALEETGYRYGGPLIRLHQHEHFTAYLARVDDEFPVTLCDESTGYDWWDSAVASPEPLHPGLAEALQVLAARTELDVAELIRDGVLPSPQRFRNMLLVAMRVTGTGLSFRAEIKEDERVIRKAEYVYRAPELYCNERFLARCMGLPVIMDHPRRPIVGADGQTVGHTVTLDGEEFRGRSVGASMLPYIKSDEVWTIARIYDVDGSWDELATGDVSTSPTVVLGNGDENVKVLLDGGTEMLVEGEAPLLDHLAIVTSARGGRGVWDKGGDASGVQLDNEEFLMTDKEKADAEAAIQARIDEACSKARADERAKADSEAAARKAKADADAEMERKAKADSDAAAAKAIADAAEEQKRADEEAVACADAQGKAETVFAAFGRQAPGRQAGESRDGYVRRLVGSLKSHSKRFKDADIGALAGLGLDAVADAVYADAMEEARTPAGVPDGTLVSVPTRDATGRVITSYRGKPGAWMDMFKLPRRAVVNINKGA